MKNKRYICLTGLGVALALTACEAEAPQPAPTETVVVPDDEGGADPCGRTTDGTQCP